jgi:hypothetical protein
MRTVEQISKELRAAREEEKQAKSKREKLEQEMKEIYLAAKAELGIEDKHVFRPNLHRGV